MNIKSVINKETWNNIISTFLASRILIILIAWIAFWIVKKPESYKAPSSILGLFFQWDSGWYISIVNNGYFYNPGEYSSVNFFPLFPMLVKLFSSVFGNPVLIGFIISHIVLLIAAFYLYKLIKLDYKDKNIASKTVFYMLIFPTSFFLSIFYSEGLFICLVIASFYYARKKQWLTASILGFFVCLTRTTGVLIFIPLLIEYLNINFRSFKIDFKKIKADILYLLLVPLGLFSYMGYLYVKFKDPLAFVHTQTSAWGHKFVFITTTISNNLNRYDPFSRYLFFGTAIFAFIIIIYLIYSKVRLSYIVYSALHLFIYTSNNLLEGIPRYIAVIFPLYIGLALLGNKSKFFDKSYTIFSIMLLTLFTILFTNGYWFP